METLGGKGTETSKEKWTLDGEKHRRRMKHFGDVGSGCETGGEWCPLMRRFNTYEDLRCGYSTAGMQKI